MNQTQIKATEQYLIGTIAEILTERGKADLKAKQAEIATHITKGKAIHAKLLPLIEQFSKIQDEIQDIVGKDRYSSQFYVNRITANVNTQSWTGDRTPWQVMIRTINFCSKNKTHFYCPESYSKLAEESVKLVERYILEITIGTGIVELDAFATQLKTKLNS